MRMILAGCALLLVAHSLDAQVIVRASIRGGASITPQDVVVQHSVTAVWSILK